MTQPVPALPVFVDVSGRRTRIVQWSARGICAVVALAALAVGLTLFTGVPLPGLGGLLAPGHAPRPPAHESSTPTTRTPALEEQGARSAGSAGSVDRSVGSVAGGAAAPRGHRHVTAATTAPATTSASPGSAAAGGAVAPPAGSTPTSSKASKSQATQHASAKASPRATDKSTSPRASTQEPNSHSTVKSSNASTTGVAHQKAVRDAAAPVD